VEARTESGEGFENVDGVETLSGVFVDGGAEDLAIGSDEVGGGERELGAVTGAVVGGEIDTEFAVGAQEIAGQVVDEAEVMSGFEADVAEHGEGEFVVRFDVERGVGQLRRNRDEFGA